MKRPLHGTRREADVASVNSGAEPVHTSAHPPSSKSRRVFADEAFALRNCLDVTCSKYHSYAAGSTENRRLLTTQPDLGFARRGRTLRSESREPVGDRLQPDGSVLGGRQSHRPDHGV